MGDSRCRILKMSVDVIDLEGALERLLHLVGLRCGAYVCVSNVHMCMVSYDSDEFRQVVDSADLVLPDGKPLSWAQRILGHKTARQVRGQDIMLSLCDLSVRQGLSVGLYGGANEAILEKVKVVLGDLFPGLDITFSYSPPFRAHTDKEDIGVVDAINAAEVDLLFVGIGCPKQEIWMAEHKARLNCVMLGVGAAFDFVSGEKKHAPRWIQSLGMEWLFRLCSEPRRLWKRYLDTNTRFLILFLLQVLNVRRF